jgi:hypothetical protein
MAPENTLPHLMLRRNIKRTGVYAPLTFSQFCAMVAFIAPQHL